MTRISFLGAAGTVTGSNYLVETETARVLVDCGLFQGGKALRERNWSPPAVALADLDAVLLTHAHIDHSGYVPRLCAEGYRGRVHCTSGTEDLLQILLPDAGHLEEEAARLASRHSGKRKHTALPLFTADQARSSLEQLSAHDFEHQFSPAPGLVARFSRAGHILGSACLILQTESESIIFSGDVGRPNDPIMRPPEALPAAEYLVIESTYGDRRHPEAPASETLEQVVLETAEGGGTILIPSFAVGRAQHILHLLAELRHAGRIPDIPVFLDSPMSINATEIFCRHKDDHRLSESQCHSMCKVAHYTRTASESNALARRSGPMIIISASGMASGGRILHHLRRCLPDPRHVVLFVGFQAAGTRGRSLLDGADEVKIHGQYVPVRARVTEIPALSAHADYAELLDWLRMSNIAPRRTFVTHGEAAAADALRRRLRDHLGWDAVVPKDGSSWTLDSRHERS